MPLVDITNDIKRSRLKQQQLGEEKEEKKSSSLVTKPIPSTLRRISISKKSSSKDDGKEGGEEEEQQLPPTRSKRDSLSGSGSSPFSKVSVEQPGEFLESEPSLSQSDCVSNKDDEEDEEQQNVLVQQNEQKQQCIRQSRRQKHQPQRLGDLLEWNDIKSNALYEKYDPEKAHREQQMKLLTNAHTTNNSNRVMEEGEEKRSKASDYQSGQNSKAVLEEEADDDGLPKKSIREKLRDAWDGDGYYAKLMKEQDSGPSSSSSRTSSTPPTSNGNSNNNKSKTNNSNGKKEGLKVYCDKENPVAHKVNRGAKKASGLGGGLSSSGGGGKLAVGCGNTGGGLANHAPKLLVQRTALTSALGNVTNASSSSSSNNVNATVSGTAYMFGNLKSIQAPSATQNSSSSNNASEKPTNSTPPSSSLSSSSSSSFASESSINTGLTKKDTNNTNNETLLNALKAENDLLRKQRNDVKLTHLKLKKELDDLKRNARIAVSKLCAKLPNNSRGVELDALAFLKLSS
ncbi:unnamed protein product [Bathycoccus prasinos]